jgi:predicted transcriptional regulator
MFNASRKTTIRRSDVEMYMDILAAIKASPRPTRIMYGCNMSWKPFQDRLEFLIRAGFVNAIVTGEDVDARSREALYLTPTGDDILSSWKKAMDMMYEALERVLKR